MEPTGYDYRLVRPEDLFVAQLTLYNLVVDESRRRLMRVTSGEEASIEIELPTQHYAEPSLQHLWVHAVPLFAGTRCRIEATAPEGIDQFELGERGIIGAIAEWTLNPGGTWIDVLATLLLQPPPGMRILADPLPATDRHPLWSARAPLAPGEPVVLAPYGLPMRLPAGRFGVQPDGGPGPVLRPHARIGFWPKWRCHSLTITPLGGTASIEGPDQAIDQFPAWGHTHRTSLGRTAYARQVVTGHLSSGHAATITTVAERQFRRQSSNDDDQFMTTAGVLQQRMTLVITEPYVDLRAAGAGHGPSAFAGLRAPVGEFEISGTDTSRPDWLRNVGGIMSFELLAVDHAGVSTPVRMPLMFIPTGADADAVVRMLQSPPPGAPAPTMPTASVALASDPDAVVTMSAFRPSAARALGRPVVPLVQQFDVVLDQLGGIMGAPPTATFRFHDLFRASGLSVAGNPQGALLQIVPPQPGGQLAIPLPAAAVGAIGNPGLAVGAITTRAGAVAQELVTVSGPTLADVRAAFPSAKLFGTIDLLDLLPAKPFADVGGRAAIPAVRHRRTAAGEEFSYTFAARLEPKRTGPVIVRTGSDLALTSTVVRRTDGQVTQESHGTVSKIGLTLFDVVTISFGAIDFRSRGGATSFDVSGVEITFGKELEFVAELAKSLSSLGSGSGARVDVDAGGVTAGFALAVPSVAFGALMISNLSVEAWLRIPFTGAPMAFTLAVASRENPFLVTVSMFGGGGWFALEVTPEGVRRLELGIEFGGSLSLDIIVASGGVTVMAGIYVEWDFERKTTAFRAYLRASGHVSVLGIITVFVEFVLELGYDKKALTPGGRKYGIFSGRASITVGIEVLFFSKSVTLTVERSFVGSEADPTFTDCIGPSDWDTYCDAFAPVTAGA